jgi:hypothetical protein
MRMMTERKAIKRACDGCKIRKIKCSEVSPCEGCVAIGIHCTFKKGQRTRGPRNLRAKTLQVIAQTQRQHDAIDKSSKNAECPSAAGTSSSSATSADCPPSEYVLLFI